MFLLPFLRISFTLYIFYIILDTFNRFFTLLYSELTDHQSLSISDSRTVAQSLGCISPVQELKFTTFRVHNLWVSRRFQNLYPYQISTSLTTLDTNSKICSCREQYLVSGKKGSQIGIVVYLYYKRKPYPLSFQGPYTRSTLTLLRNVTFTSLICTSLSLYTVHGRESQ